MWTKILLNQISLDPNSFWPKFFFRPKKIFSGPKFCFLKKLFRTQKFFQCQNFSDQRIFRVPNQKFVLDPKFFPCQNFSDQRFFPVPNFFSKICLGPNKFISAKIFQTKDFFQSQIFFLKFFFRTHNILVDPKIFLDPIKTRDKALPSWTL